jgi:hypothetical protein
MSNGGKDRVRVANSGPMTLHQMPAEYSSIPLLDTDNRPGGHTTPPAFTRLTVPPTDYTRQLPPGRPHRARNLAVAKRPERAIMPKSGRSLRAVFSAAP